MIKKIRTGKVVSNAMMNTIVVATQRMKKHPLYSKQYRVTKKYHVDTAGIAYEMGDVVKIEETRPQSKTKSWRVIEKVS